MKKINAIKFFMLACIMALASILPLCFTACSNDNNGDISLIVSHRIYDVYNIKEQICSDTPNKNNNIKVGQYYKVILDIKCDDLKASIQDDAVHVQMIVKMGDYENEYNHDNLLETDIMFNGYEGSFTPGPDSGVYNFNFTLTRSTGLPDFSKCEFYICLRSLKGSSVEKDDMTVEFQTDGKNNKHIIKTNDVTFYDEKSKAYKASYTVSLVRNAGELGPFTYKDNVKSSSAGLNAVEIRVPSNSVNIHVDVYNAEKTGRYKDGKTFEESEFFGTLTNKSLTVNFSTLMLELMANGVESYNELINSLNPQVCVIVTADGGINYNSKSFEFMLNLKTGKRTEGDNV